MAEEAAAGPIRYGDATPRGRRAFRWIVAVVLLLVLVGGAVVAELTVRSFAENAVAAGIEQQLPDGVEGDVDVQFGGVSFIVQYLTGEIEAATLVSESLTVGGASVDARVEARGIPVDGGGVSGPIESATGRITIPQESVVSLLRAQGIEGDIALGDGVLTYRTATEILGQSIGFEIVTVPTLDGGRIVFQPQSATIDGAAFEFDATELLGLVAPQGLGVCVAQYLPAAISLDSVTVTDAAAVIDLSAANIDPAAGTLTTTGACS